MNKTQIVNKTISYVKRSLEKESSGHDSGHDWWHIERVQKMAKYIARKEGGDLFVVELASLLHDIADWKFHGGNETMGPKLAKQWLKSLAVDKKTIENVCYIISNISFLGERHRAKMKTLEGKIVQDADRLDALGAIGIARCFVFSGYSENPIYNPNVRPTKNKSVESYKKSNATAINHFYEKLLLLKNRMNTKTAKRIAEERHQFMEEFLTRFFKEWRLKE